MNGLSEVPVRRKNPAQGAVTAFFRLDGGIFTTAIRAKPCRPSYNLI
jgi:hypothetical protein